MSCWCSGFLRTTNVRGKEKQRFHLEGGVGGVVVVPVIPLHILMSLTRRELVVAVVVITFPRKLNK